MINPSRKAKIKWQCRRGMLELDLILVNFIEKGLDNLNENEFNAFELLLTYPDPELYSWLMGSTFPVEKELLTIVELIQMYHRSR